MSNETTSWLVVFCTIGLFWSDTKSMAWGFLLGADLALGLYCFLSFALRV